MKPVYGKDLCEDLKAVGECFAPWRLDIFGKGIIDKLNGSNDERIAVLKTFIEFKGSWRYDLNRETFKSDASCGVFIPSEEKTFLKRLAQSLNLAGIHIPDYFADEIVKLENAEENTPPVESFAITGYWPSRNERKKYGNVICGILVDFELRYSKEAQKTFNLILSF